MSLATMNWKRGLLRLWAVVSVLWVGVAFYSNDTVQRVQDTHISVKYSGPKITSVWIDGEWKTVSGTATNPETGDKAYLIDNAWVIKSTSIWPPIFDFAKLAFIPPLLLLALGYIGLWVGRGFRR